MKSLFTLLLLLSVQLIFATHSQIIFVNQQANGQSDGTSWENAFTGLQDALQIASTGQQIWVATGIYQPTKKSEGTTDFHLAFEMVQGVEIYGGFSGTEDPETFDLSQRNFSINETVLSGTIPSELKSLAPVVYHVIRNQNNGLDSTAVIDGFTISNASAQGSGRDGKGAGMININSHPTIRNVHFTYNYSATHGGAIFNENSHPHIINCLFEGNEAELGGAISNENSSPVISNSTFRSNIATENGGAIMNSGNTSAQVFTEINGTKFYGNQAKLGGAIFNGRFAHVFIELSRFEGNTVSGSGGAIYNHRNNTQVHYSTFVDNMALGTGNAVGGGAIYNNTSTAEEGNTITHSKFENNHAHISNARGGAIFNNLNPGHFTMESSDFNGNTAQYGGGVYNNAGNNIHADNSSVKITRTSFINHTATYGAGIYNNRHHLQIISGRFSGNHATATNASGAGGGIFSYYGKPLIINSLFTGNKADNHGAALAGNQTEIILTNTTISGNFAARGGAFAGITRATVIVRNSIIMGNRASVDGNQLFLCANCEASADHSIVGNDAKDIHTTGGAVYHLTNTSSFDPVFTNPIYPTFQNTPNTLGAYMIEASSPAIDTGNNDHFPIQNLNSDFRGVDRILDGNANGHSIIDIGAYEYYFGPVAPIVPASGNGTVFQPYHIQSLENLYWIAQDRERWSLQYIQTANIDASSTKTWYDGKGWIPIGNQQHHFTGNYNGNGHSISGVFINRPDQNDVGLFGSLKSGARISMLALYGVDITGGQNTGGLAGSIKGEWEKRTVLAETSVTGKVNGKDNTGGLVGAGGYHADIYNSFTRATVTGEWATGGLAGSYWGGTGKIHNSYAASEVIGSPNAVGGLVATGSPFVYNSYWDTEVSALNISNGGTGLTTLKMKEQTTFTIADWNFEQIWDMYAHENEGYPFLIVMGSPLPVTLIHFSAESNEGSVAIHWITASEINSESFTIEHSHDGKHWSTIGSVKAAGNSNDMIYYSFTDHNPFSGVTYYRLIQADFDGTIEAFGPVYAEYKPPFTVADKLFTVFPNPNNGSFTIAVKPLAGYFETREMDIKILSPAGQIVFSQTYIASSIGENIRMDISDLPSGMYFVRIFSAIEGVNTIPFIVK